MGNKVFVRKATLKDLEKFFQVFRKNISSQFPEYTLLTRHFFIEKEFSKKVFRNWLKKNEGPIFLAVVNSKIVGFLAARTPYGGVAFCSWVAVKEECHGQGIGSILLEAWEKESKKEGAHKLQLWTDARNLEFYKKRGFVLVGDVPDNYFGAHDHLFIKSLGKSQEKNYLR